MIVLWLMLVLTFIGWLLNRTSAWAFLPGSADEVTDVGSSP